MLDRFKAVIRSPDRDDLLRRKSAVYLSRLPVPRGVRERGLDRLASKIVWIFGTGRNGSTWMARMLSDSGPHRLWNEPLVGALFGDFHYGRASDKVSLENVLSPAYRETWLPLIRSFVLESAFARYPDLASSRSASYLFVKEPNGSTGAPLLVSALPESRMIFLIRDPRDSVASKLDARSDGGWLHGERETTAKRRDLIRATQQSAITYQRGITRSFEAYREHRGPKSLVSYEAMRSDPSATLDRVASDLELSLDRSRLAESIEKHSWENIPEDQKGSGKKFRKATSGGWREDLSPDQIKTVEDVTGPLMDEFGYARNST